MYAGSRNHVHCHYLKSKKRECPVDVLRTHSGKFAPSISEMLRGSVCPGKHENKNAHSLRRHYPDQVQRDFLSPYRNNPG